MEGHVTCPGRVISDGLAEELCWRLKSESQAVPFLTWTVTFLGFAPDAL